ncbi:conserved hypothetical protein [Rubrivivax sp. A210]|uniref:DUF4255 domain-containing protein n=1 Tax=Rubrivivax sp. A210 TaxID=2772301 RepID=UPI001919D978|nr:DUF4255 domain-containing protein [Rubrivivax sp. A210]CAD5372259.1 conserved hypothetical protein [Rubrivivax sp. A210]
MIAEVFKFLREHLNEALPRDSAGGAVEDLFVYVGSGKEDAVSFKADAVSLLLVRVEQDATLRPPDLYTRISSVGSHQKVEPEIRLNLSLLLVARFPDDYLQALHHLSRVIRYFQNHRVFNPANAPDLPDGISQLVLELVTPTFSEQNEIWGTLRTAYLPSAMYKLRMVVFQDDEGQPTTAVKELMQSVTQVPQT